MNTTPLTELKNLAERIPNALTEANRMSLENLYQRSLSDLEDPNSLFTYTLAKAMRKRVSGEQPGKHIYLQQFAIPQIRLFELLIQHFPLANLSQQCINTLLVNELKHHARPVLMDIGIGTGMQVVNILDGLMNAPASQIQHLTIVGIEPFADALSTAEVSIGRVATTAPFAVTFLPKVAFIEQLELPDLTALLPEQHDGIWANASFALHHIRLESQRKQVFKNLKQIGVKGLALSEPNSDHYEPNYASRFTNCVNHYGALFKIIDNLAITTNEKAALKLFFGREIDDVLGNPEEVRVEKHYATHQWRHLLTQSGFTLQKRPTIFPELALNGTMLSTDLPDRYATVFNGEEITSLFWAE
jgi:hypothetical protein